MIETCNVEGREAGSDESDATALNKRGEDDMLKYIITGIVYLAIPGPVQTVAAIIVTCVASYLIYREF